MHRCRRRTATIDNSAGFTLLDLMLVVTILGIVTAAAVVTFDTDEMALDANARAIAADLYRAQRLAVETAMPVGVDFDSSAGATKFVLADGRTPTEAETELRALPRLDIALVDELVAAKTDDDATYEKARMTTVDFGGQPKVLFLPDGRPAVGGLVRVALDGKWLCVRVQDATGRITITGP